MAERDASKVAFVCSHCGDMFSTNIGDFCSKCKTPEKREKLDQDNREIWAESKMEFHCKFCSREK